MPKPPAARAINQALSLSYRPTALFVGGTSGLGEGTARALARATKGNAHILICGRNKASADRIFATFPQHEQSKYEFVACDVSLIKNVVKAADEIKAKIGDAPLNYLVLSQGILTLAGFTPTEEGIDQKMSLHFYSRWKFVDELLPKLELAAAQKQEARVMSILAPGKGNTLDTTDLGLKKTFSVAKASAQAPAYNDIFVDEYSKRHPTLSFIHIFPGLVDTPGITKHMPWYIKVAGPVVKLASRSIDDAGEVMASALTSSDFHQGGYYLNENAEVIPAEKIKSDETSRQILVEHYKKEVSV